MSINYFTTCLNKKFTMQQIKIFLFFLLCTFSVGLFAQNLTTYDFTIPTEGNSGGQIGVMAMDISLNSQEEDLKNKLLATDRHEAYWIVNVAQLTSRLNSNQLSFSFPGSSVSTTFFMQNITADENTKFFWEGYTTDGSTANIWKSGDGTEGEFYIHATQTGYGLYVLSPDKSLLIRYNSEIMDRRQDYCHDDQDPDFENPDDFEVSGEEEPHEREACDNNIISVLFLFTEKAKLEGNMDMLADFVIGQLNASTSSSGLSTSQILFKKANTVLLPDFVEEKRSWGTLKKLRENANAIALRNANFADIVVLFCGGSFKRTGGAADRYSDSESPYCLATTTATRMSLKATHGVGHVMGARHQNHNPYCGPSWEQESSTHPLDYAHAWQMPTNNARTIMSDCFTWEGSALTRVGVWSSRNGTFFGESTGNLINDNSLRLKLRAPEVACFRRGEVYPPIPYGPFTANIVGKSKLCYGQETQYSVEFGTPQPVAPITYLWEIRNYTTQTWDFAGNLPSVVVIAPPYANGAPNVIELRVKVTDAAGTVRTVVLVIQLQTCFGGSSGNRSLSSSNSTAPENITLSPNPSNGIVQIQYSLEDKKGQTAQLDIYDLNGRLMSHFESDLASGAWTTSVKDWNPGLYLVSLRDNTGRIIYTQKLVVEKE